MIAYRHLIKSVSGWVNGQLYIHFAQSCVKIAGLVHEIHRGKYNFLRLLNCPVGDKREICNHIDGVHFLNKNMEV